MHSTAEADQAAMAQIVTDTYTSIKADADQDNAIWQIGSIDDGYQCATPLLCCLLLTVQHLQLSLSIWQRLHVGSSSRCSGRRFSHADCAAPLQSRWSAAQLLCLHAFAAPLRHGLRPNRPAPCAQAAQPCMMRRSAVYIWPPSSRPCHQRLGSPASAICTLRLLPALDLRAFHRTGTSRTQPCIAKCKDP